MFMFVFFLIFFRRENMSEFSPLDKPSLNLYSYFILLCIKLCNAKDLKMLDIKHMGIG